MTAAVTGPVLSGAEDQRLDESGPAVAEAAASPSPSPTATPVATPLAAPAAVDICANPAVSAALAAGDDEGAMTAAGGAAVFRDAVAGGRAPCVALDDPSHDWVIVNKLRPFSPVDWEPASLALPSGVQSLEGGRLRPEAATGLSAMAAAAVAEGAGEIALDSGYRSYATQQTNYGDGGPSVEASVARPGYSEHQSGLAADVVACSGGCGTLDDLAASPQGAWIAANAWRYGWIVRYESGKTDVTGYIPEPWHLRYVGTQLAAAYHAGGWHSLEEFFGLSAAPDYAG
ncbi:D-alanyl-D-alanine carboxypeptidase family protein [Microbacterium rhizomatis]|uniref:D-alanyl-D-alanine carboxypeptidase family protein n=1 Tax=Microbacterium rhizomatis TaxID=1631477 RepID=A0A5J5IYZ3_9MICO|nr:D-alanyl-D-alanine carboxypeptidase family protein [Microbacterium rhizomatis]